MTYDVMAALRSTGAILEGHFELSSGKHSPTYFQCARLLSAPPHAHEIGRAVAAMFVDRPIDVVIAPAIGGIVLSYVVADALGVPSLFAERQEAGFALRRGFELLEGQRVLVVEDVVTTGGSALAVVELVRRLRAEPVAIGAIVQRRKQAGLGVEFRALALLEAQLAEPGDCPQCAAGSRATKPGSRPG